MEQSETDDIVITGSVRARELRFEEVPQVEVRFLDSPDNDSAWHTQRENVPGSVEPGMSYHNIAVRTRVAARIVEQHADTAPPEG